MPSTVTLYPAFFSAVWICSTPGPLSPNLTLSLGEVTTRPLTVVVAVVPADDEVLAAAVVVVAAGGEVGAVVGAVVDNVVGEARPVTGELVAVDLLELLLDLVLLLHAPSQRAPTAQANRVIRRVTMRQH